MATKMCFLVGNNRPFEEDIISFTYIKGLAFSQKQKNILSFHSAIQSKFPNAKILEVSTKSNNELGVALSAFNLKLNGLSVESIFQSSKVFSDGSQFVDLMYASPKDAKLFIAKSSIGALSHFRYNGTTFPLEPRSLFYDYLYTSALKQIPDISKHLAEFDIFTDIEFNEKKQFNCQARSCAIYSFLLKTNQTDYFLSSVENFVQLYTKMPAQLTFEDL